MITKREWVFETNSSSMHSFTISEAPELNVITPKDWVIEIQFGEFGWGYDTYNDPETMMSYIATYLFNKTDPFVPDIVEGKYVWNNEEIKKFESIIKDQTGATTIIYRLGDKYNPFWYIDHQSRGIADKAREDCFNFIFKKTTLIIDNDNH